MTKEHYPEYYITTFEAFVKRFSGRKWYLHNKFNNSLFADADKNAIHANMIVFSGIGYMAKNKSTYYKIKKFVEKYIKENYNKLEKKDVFE